MKAATTRPRVWAELSVRDKTVRVNRGELCSVPSGLCSILERSLRSRFALARIADRTTRIGFLFHEQVRVGVPGELTDTREIALGVLRARVAVDANLKDDAARGAKVELHCARAEAGLVECRDETVGAI